LLNIASIIVTLDYWNKWHFFRVRGRCCDLEIWGKMCL